MNDRPLAQLYLDGVPQEVLQPHEGVAGTDRAGDPMFSGAAIPVMRLTKLLYSASLNATPACRELNQELTNPKVGDLVMELTHAYRLPVVKGFGYLVADRREWWHTDEQWAEIKEDWGDPRSTDHASYIQYGPRPIDICRWTNHTLLKVPL